MVTTVEISGLPVEFKVELKPDQTPTKKKNRSLGNGDSPGYDVDNNVDLIYGSTTVSIAGQPS